MKFDFDWQILINRWLTDGRWTMTKTDDCKSIDIVKVKKYKKG